MGRPIGKRIRDPLWWRDQGLHALAGLVACAAVADPLAYAAGWSVALSAFLGVFAAGLGAITYEAVQNWRDKPTIGGQMDSIFDVGGFWFGASLGVLTLLGV